jgi:hypothetical protein
MTPFDEQLVDALLRSDLEHILSIDVLSWLAALFG